MTAADIQRKAAELGKLTVRMTTEAGSGHPSSGLSLAHIVSYADVPADAVGPGQPVEPGRRPAGALRRPRRAGRLRRATPISAASSASPSERPHRLTPDDSTSSASRDSVLDGHPNPAEGFPFFDAATGSLGQGLSRRRRPGAWRPGCDEIDKRIFVHHRRRRVARGPDLGGRSTSSSTTSSRTSAPIFNCNGQGQADYVSQQQSADDARGQARGVRLRRQG